MAERLLQHCTCAGNAHISSQLPGAQEKLWMRAVLSWQIWGAAGSREGPQTVPRVFSDQRLSALSEWSQASENISFTRGVLRGFSGVLAQSVPLQEHDICLSLPCPPCLSADHSNSAEPLSIFSFSHYFCTHLPPPVLILVASTFCGIFPHSLSLLCLCLIVLILSLWNPNSPFASHLLFFTSIIIYQVLNHTGLKMKTKGIKLYPYCD